MNENKLLQSPSGIIHHIRYDYGGASGKETFCSEYISGDNWKVLDRTLVYGDKVCKKCRVAKRGIGTRGIYRPMKRRFKGRRQNQ